MASPGTPSSITRPFSPSPPRENRHTASRPPSLLFRAPPRGAAITAEVSAADVAGLPVTPGHEHRHEGLLGPAARGNDSYFGLGEFDVASSSQRSDRKKAGAAGHGGHRRVMSMADDDDSASSASSASPPLGAASILSTIASAQPATPVARPQSPSSTIRSRLSDAPVTPGSTTRRTASYEYDLHPGSPGSDVSHSSKAKSIPRLKQPTVVRSTSGRGLAFLPPPAELSTSESSFTIRQRPARARAPSTPSRPVNQSPLPSDSASPQFNHASEESIEEASLGRPEQTRQLLSPVDREAGSDEHTGDEEGGDVMYSNRTDLPGEEDHITLNEIVEPESSSKVSFDLLSVPASELPDPADEVRRAMDGMKSTARPQSSDHTAEKVSADRIYVPPYQVREKARRQQYILGPNTAAEEAQDKLDLSIYASIARRSRVAPVFPDSGLELDLSWGGRSSLSWLPGGKLIPHDIGFALIRRPRQDVSEREAGELSLLRVAVKSVVERLPVVWRLAALL